MHTALRALFEEQVEFRLKDGTPVEGNIFIGDTEIIAVEVLRDDPDAHQAEFEPGSELSQHLLGASAAGGGVHDQTDLVSADDLSAREVEHVAEQPADRSTQHVENVESFAGHRRTP